jgi:hypothetical protein
MTAKQIRTFTLLLALALLGFLVGERISEQHWGKHEVNRTFVNVCNTARSPDGSLFALSFVEERQTRYEIYDTYSGDLKTKMIWAERMPFATMLFSGNNKTFVVGHREPLVYSTETGKLVKKIEAEGRDPKISLSNNGDRVAVRWLTTDGFKEGFVLSAYCLKKRGHGRIFQKAAPKVELEAQFNLDREGKHLIYGSRRKLWRRNLKKGKEVELPYSKLNSVMNEGRWLALSRSEGTIIQILDIQTAKEIGKLESPKGIIFVSDACQGQRVLTSSRKNPRHAQVWEFPSGKMLSSVYGEPHLCQLSHYGKYLSVWTDSTRETPRIQEVESGRVVSELHWHWRFAAYAATEGLLSLWSVRWTSGREKEVVFRSGSK